jgi:flagellar hook-length control protein FliK
VPSVASQVTASINQHQNAKASASANGKDRNASSPFEEMLDSAVAAEDPAPSTNDAPPAKAPKASATTPEKSKPADDAPATDDATPAQASDLERDEAARGEIAEGNDAILADQVLAADAGDGAPPQPVKVVEAAAPAEKPIAEIGLAAFLEAVASATTPQPEAEDATDEPPKAEADVKADVDTPAGATGPVKADAVAAAVVTMTAEVAADPAQPDGAVPTSGAKTTPAVGASPALPQAATSPAQHDAGSHNLGEGKPADAAVTDVEASLAEATEAPKPHPEAHKHRAETPAQHNEAPKLQPAMGGASKGDAVEPEAPAPHPSQVTPRHAETADAKPAKAGVNPVDTPAPAKPADAPQTLQTLPQMTAPTVGTIQSPVVQKDVTAVASAVPIEGVAVEIAVKASEGMKSFEIRLDPPELGRIHVRLDVDRNGEITSRVMADRQDTLDLLRRDAPQLERALNDAGLRTSNNGLQFSLRDQGQSQQHQQQQALPNAARLIIPDESLAAELTQRGYYRPAGSAGGIDIRV